MFVGATLSSHNSLTPAQVAIYSLHDGQLFETLRTMTPGVLLSWVNLTQPSPACVATPPTVLWRDAPGQPLRVFCTSTAGNLVARPLASGTRAPLPWEVHDGPTSPMVFTPPGASVEFMLTTPVARVDPTSPAPAGTRVFGPGAATGARVVIPVGALKQSLFVGATDGSLWERTAIAGSFSWVSHGAPPGTTVVGEPATDPVAVPPASPLRVFAAAASGAVVERVIGGPGGVTWVNHLRPAVGGVPVNVYSHLVVVADLGTGAMHVFAQAGGALHVLRVATVGVPGTWVPIGAPASTRPNEVTRVEGSPGGANIVQDATSGPFVRFFIAVSRQMITPARPTSVGDGVQAFLSFITLGLVPSPEKDTPLVSAPTEELWECMGNVRRANTGFSSNLGAPRRPALPGTDWYRLAKPAGAVPDRSLVYTSSMDAEGLMPESLDEWSTSLAGSTPLGLMPAGVSSPCAVPGSRRFSVGYGS